MPALIDIRRRIRSVKNTQQITKALKMVSAAKLRRAQESMFAARPYARTMAQVLKDVAARTEGEENHPLFRAASKDGKALIIVVTADKGLCGAFNSSLLRVAQRFLLDNAHRQIAVDAVGRKGRDFLRRRTTIRKEYIGVFQSLVYAKAQEIAQSAMKAFLDREADEVVLLFNEFKSVLAQRLLVMSTCSSVYFEKTSFWPVFLQISITAFGKCLPVQHALHRKGELLSIRLVMCMSWWSHLPALRAL